MPGDKSAMVRFNTYKLYGIKTDVKMFEILFRTLRASDLGHLVTCCINLINYRALGNL